MVGDQTAPIFLTIACLPTLEEDSNIDSSRTARRHLAHHAELM